ncbi:hypothetical protein MKY95_07580 [Paenibacillus sp. FSL P4-0176]|uniref:hypothetical protein n=1 Tax=Paenibacillus sp. FSL P4-0176 TaxID=2921631 RepID=UPI0030CD7C5F
MKLHKDGTVEGTPQEIAEYNQKTMEQQVYVIPLDDVDDAEHARSIIEAHKSGKIPNMRAGVIPQPISNADTCTTKDLVSALKGRTGVEVHGMGKEVEFSLISGSLRHDRKGKATVLIIQE